MSVKILKHKNESPLEAKFLAEWQRLYPEILLEREYKFASVIKRKFRFDFAHPASKIGIEINGGIWKPKSAHSGGTALLRDYEKTCIASYLGWRSFPLADKTIEPRFLAMIAEAIADSAGSANETSIPRK